MTDGPLDEPMADTPGPEATPAQEAFVTGLLASLRADDPPMPDDVIRRLDGVLAQERLTRPPGPLVGPTTGTSDAEGAAPAPLPDNVTVLPTGAARRSSPTTRWLGGLAAAAVLVLGGVVVTQSGLLGGAGNGSTSADTAAPVAAMRSTGTAYSAASLEPQVQTLVASADGKTADTSTTVPEVTSESAPESSSPASGSATGTPQAAAYDLPTLAACLAALKIPAGIRALVSDRGTYDGEPAEVLVLPTEGDVASLDVYVVEPDCGATGAEPVILQYLKVKRP